MHPSVQLEFVNFYKRYCSIIINSCSRSKFSLRHPYKIASHYYEKEIALPFPESSPRTNLENIGSQPEEYTKSYFAYQQYGAIYRFYDSQEFHQIEKRFCTLKKLDISKCFESIYTHSIAWAIKSKTFAKKTITNNSFELEFDKLMRCTNDNETAGIIVGPEISRIFAEIILQKIDLELLNELSSEATYKQDYEIKRYVDDYFIFYNSPEIGEKICSKLTEKLRCYKLHLNKSKQETLSRPFISEISIAKNNINIFFNEQFKNLIPEGRRTLLDNYIFSDPIQTSNSIIYSLKCIIKESGASYSSTAAFIFSKLIDGYTEILRKCELIHQKRKQTYHQNLFNLITIFLELGFFVYSMTPTDNTTYYLTKIISLTLGVLDKSPSEISHSLRNKILTESLTALTSRATRDENLSTEKINLFLLLSCLNKKHLLSEDDLFKIFNLDLSIELEENARRVEYFHIMSALYYIEERDLYKNFRTLLLDIIAIKFKNIRMPLQHTELLLLFVDTLTCPYLDHTTKFDLVKLVYKAQMNSEKSINKNAEEILAYFSESQWFINWGTRNRTSAQKRIDFTNFLKKKESTHRINAVGF